MSKRRQSGVQDRVDFLIVTALKKERDAILTRIDSGYQRVEDTLDPITYYKGQVSLPITGRNYNVVVVCLLDSGNLEAGVIAAIAIGRWLPENVVMVGIAAGREGKVALGDVVVARTVIYIEPGKIEPDGKEERPDVYRCNSLLTGRAENYEASDWKSDIRVEVPDTQHAVFVRNAHFRKDIVSSDDVIAARAVMEKLSELHPTMLALAMEGAGVAKAAARSSGEPRFLEVRGICDFGTENKDDVWQEVAADSAAAFVIGLLKYEPVPPIEAEQGATATTNEVGLLILLEQSMRHKQIANSEILSALGNSAESRDLKFARLDFTDLLKGGLLTDPETAIQRIMDPQGELFAALGQREESEMVFCGIAHIPLLVLTGHLISDRQKVKLLDFHPSPGSETWAWPPKSSRYPKLSVTYSQQSNHEINGEVIIRFSVSNKIQPAHTVTVVPNSPLSIDIEIPKPAHGSVISERQVREYGSVFRQILDELRADWIGVKRIHLFYAGPVSLAFHIGQRISENIHHPVVVWNYHQGYDWGLDLSAAIIGDSSIIRPLAI